MIPPLPTLPGIDRVVVSAVYGGYEQLADPGVRTPGWPFVCFSDTQDHPGWHVIPWRAPHPDPVRAAKPFKVLLHRVFPDARYSLWMDGNFALNCDLDAMVATYLADADLALHRHPERDCAYEEARVCIAQRKDDVAVMERQMAGYAAEGFPAHAGLAACGVILRRHTEATRLLFERWWEEITRGSRRDQLSFDYVAWSLGVRYAVFDSHFFEGPLFPSRGHGMQGD